MKIVKNLTKLLSYQVAHTLQLIECLKLKNRVLDASDTGTGKTYTSITIAETIKSINPNMKILVILPARLKTNFIDELKGINNYEILSYESLLIIDFKRICLKKCLL